MIRNALTAAAGGILGLLIVVGTALGLMVTTTAIDLNLYHQGVQADTSSDVNVQGFTLALASSSAAGDSPGGAVEATASNPSVNNAISLAHWTYKFTVTETSITAWDSSTTYTVTVWGDGTLLATLYLKNATAEPLATEGVTVTVDVGSAISVPDSIDIQVEKTG